MTYWEDSGSLTEQAKLAGGPGPGSLLPGQIDPYLEIYNGKYPNKYQIGFMFGIDPF